MRLKAFVVEDNPAIRESLIETLSELAGIDTAGTASNQKDAVAWLTDPEHDWDIAIVDLLLEPGGGSGFGVLSGVRNRLAHQKVVVLTGTANLEVRRRCEEVGSDGVFDKSMETEALLEFCANLAAQAHHG